MGGIFMQRPPPARIEQGRCGRDSSNAISRGNQFETMPLQVSGLHNRIHSFFVAPTVSLMELRYRCKACTVPANGG